MNNLEKISFTMLTELYFNLNYWVWITRPVKASFQDCAMYDKENRHAAISDMLNDSVLTEST